MCKQFELLGVLLSKRKEELSHNANKKCYYFCTKKTCFTERKKNASLQQNLLKTLHFYWNVMISLSFSWHLMSFCNIFHTLLFGQIFFVCVLCSALNICRVLNQGVSFCLSQHTKVKRESFNHYLLIWHILNAILVQFLCHFIMRCVHLELTLKKTLKEASSVRYLVAIASSVLCYGH